MKNLVIREIIQNKFLRSWMIISFILLLVFFTLVSFSENDTSEKTCTCGTLIAVNFGPTVPGDNKLVTGQTQADCFGWAEFVALNWPAKQGEKFGESGSTTPVQWETYITREVLLNSEGTKPPAWGSTQKAPSHLAAFVKDHPLGTKVLFRTHKFNSSKGMVIDETGEAFPNNAPNWLGAQNGTNLWYEVLVNEDEYNYIVDNGFYNADTQLAYVAQGKVISLPEGSGTAVGSIELKAAWMEVTDPANEKWNRYKLSKAVLVDPGYIESRLTTVALVGLHIIHKTESQPTWFWTTFEHMDNVPGDNPNATSYNLYNVNCTAQTVTVPGSCGQNTNKQDSTYSIPCKPNVPPSYYLCAGAGPVPTQVERKIPIDVDARAVNAKMQAFISKNFPGSVWSNYQLVNMIWSTTPQNNQNNKVPQGLKSMQPVIPMANTTAETFIQTTTCYGCHQFAPIAPTVKVPNPSYAADFSFVLEFANYAGKE